MNDIAQLISKALDHLKAATIAQVEAIVGLETALEQAVQQGIEGIPASTAPTSDHRRHHRRGVQRKIDADPELRTFIRARIDRLTFKQVEAEVAAHFPPDRRVSSSRIHAWWHREKTRSGVGWP